jgi:hypothetical protein
MDKFEYKEEVVPHEIESLPKWLDRAGTEGWEAIHFYSSGVIAIVLLKRKITTNV